MSRTTTTTGSSSTTTTGPVARVVARVAVAVTVLVAGVLLTAGPASAYVPANDDFADARLLTEPVLFNESELTEGATAEDGEPAHTDRPPGATIWYRWTAPADVVVTTWSSLTLLSSDRTPAHALAVYTGDALSDLDTVVGAAGTEPGVTFYATAGTEYRIVLDVARRNAADGNTHLFLYASPPNDDLDNATALTGSRGSAPGYVATATREHREPQHSLFEAYGGTVWYAWTAPTTGFTRVGIECCAGNQPALAVYSGSSLADLRPVASGFSCQVGAFNACTSFRHVRGRTYHIAVQGDGTTFPLRWNQVASDCSVEGTAGDDVLQGTPRTDYVCGRGGDDTVSGLGGEDVVVGGAGRDRADYAAAPFAVEVDLSRAASFGGGGADTLQSVEDVRGSSFDDTLAGDEGDNRIRGGDGRDRVGGARGADRLSGDAGDDIVAPGRGDDVVDGGAGADELDFSRALRGVQVDLRAGTVSGQGSDRVAGVEDVRGSEHPDRLAGNRGTNVLFGGPDRDRLAGRAGDDTLVGQDGADTITGGPGTDSCRGGRGRDTLRGCE